MFTKVNFSCPSAIVLHLTIPISNQIFSIKFIVNPFPIHPHLTNLLRPWIQSYIILYAPKAQDLASFNKGPTSSTVDKAFRFHSRNHGYVFTETAGK